MKATDKLRAYWFKRENDLGGYHPLGSQTKCDLAYLLGSVLTKEVVAELKRRGYDPRTLKFSIEPKAGNDRFAPQRPAPIPQLAEPMQKAGHSDPPGACVRGEDLPRA